MKATYVNGYEWAMKLEFQADRLEAPQDSQGNQRHYLPCSECLTVLAVPWNVVAHLCNDCAKHE